LKFSEWSYLAHQEVVYDILSATARISSID
jgi:hypothetical protein